VSWSYSDGSKINHSWNAQVIGGESYTATNLNWNSTIPHSESVEFGFIGEGGGNATAVTGDVCSNN
jgi:hypothetical protein